MQQSYAEMQTKQDGARLIDAIRAVSDKGEIYTVRFLTCRFQRRKEIELKPRFCLRDIQAAISNRALNDMPNDVVKNVIGLATSVFMDYLDLRAVSEGWRWSLNHMYSVFKCRNEVINRVAVPILSK